MAVHLGPSIVSMLVVFSVPSSTNESNDSRVGLGADPGAAPLVIDV